MEFIVCGIMGYLFGNINPAYIISKRRGFDIRSKGSHNAGASNMVIVVGKKAGAITAILDIAKAYLSATFAAILFPSYRIAKEIAALFCILGHIFPVAIKFKGGKGLACIAGDRSGICINYGLRMCNTYFCVYNNTGFICPRKW